MEQKENQFLKFINQHPQVALTLGYLAVIVMGIAYDYRLSLMIGVNILDFSSLSDLVLAPVRRPQIIAFWLMFMAMFILSLWLDKLSKKEESSIKWMNWGYHKFKDKSWYGTYMLLGYVGVFTLYCSLAGIMMAEYHFKKVKKGKVEMYEFFDNKNDECFADGYLLAQTEKAYFVYDTLFKKTTIINNNLVQYLALKDTTTSIGQEVQPLPRSTKE